MNREPLPSFSPNDSQVLATITPETFRRIKIEVELKAKVVSALRQQFEQLMINLTHIDPTLRRRCEEAAAASHAESDQPHETDAALRRRCQEAMAAAVAQLFPNLPSPRILRRRPG